MFTVSALDFNFKNYFMAHLCNKIECSRSKLTSKPNTLKESYIRSPDWGPQYRTESFRFDFILENTHSVGGIWWYSYPLWLQNFVKLFMTILWWRYRWSHIKSTAFYCNNIYRFRSMLDSNSSNWAVYSFV